jgi:hypothetical protein
LHACRRAILQEGDTGHGLQYSQPQPKLTYPEEARRNREQGSVSVGLIVPPTGCVILQF